MLVIGLGCQGEPTATLETHGVTGTVRFRNGDLLDSGVIEFKSKRDQRLSMNGEIQKDGSYELTTLHEQRNLVGAVEGPCGVMVTIFNTGTPIPLTVELPDTYEVKPGGNVFNLKLKVPPPK